VVSFTPQPLYHQERTLGSHWMGPRAGLETVTKRKIPVLAGNQTPVFQSLA